MIINEFPNLIAELSPGIGTTKSWEHTINLVDDCKPIRHKLRRVPVNLRAEFDRQIDEMLEQGVLRHSPKNNASTF